MAYLPYKTWGLALCAALVLHAAALAVLQHIGSSAPPPALKTVVVGRLVPPSPVPPSPQPRQLSAPVPASIQPAPSAKPATTGAPAAPAKRPQPLAPPPMARALERSAPTPMTTGRVDSDGRERSPEPEGAARPTEPGAPAGSIAPAPSGAAPAPAGPSSARKGTPATAQHQPAPVITRLMSSMGQDTGDVSLQLLIGKNGTVLDVRELKMSEHERLNQAVLAAAKRARFTPAACDGEPVTSWWNITYRVGPNAAQSAAREASGNIDCNRLPPQ